MPTETWVRGAHHEAPPDAAYIYGHADGGVQWLIITPDPPLGNGTETTGGATHGGPHHRTKHE